MTVSTPARREFADGAELARDFAAWTAEWLGAAIETRGAALLGAFHTGMWLCALACLGASASAGLLLARGAPAGGRA